MTYAVVINLDYSSYPVPVLAELWQGIKSGMQEAGFSRDGRRFTIQLPAQEAGALARRVIDELALRPEYHNHHIYLYLREFYGYDLSATTNLMVAPIEEIVVEQD